MGLLFNRKQHKLAPEEKIYQCKFSIEANTIPAPDGFDKLDENEQYFFSEFEDALMKSKIPPYGIKLTRLSSGTFNVSCSVAYIGKIDVRLTSKGRFYMQYIGPRDSVKEIYTESIEECIAAIPMWVRCIKRCQRSK